MAVGFTWDQVPPTHRLGTELNFQKNRKFLYLCGVPRILILIHSIQFRGSLRVLFRDYHDYFRSLKIIKRGTCNEYKINWSKTSQLTFSLESCTACLLLIYDYISVRTSPVVLPVPHISLCQLEVIENSDLLPTKLWRVGRARGKKQSTRVPPHQ